MHVRSLNHRWFSTLGAVLLTVSLVPGQGLRAEDQANASRMSSALSTVKIFDVLNIFSNVGALIYFVEPNDFGIPPGVITNCTGTLIHGQVLLVAGHCTAPTAGG